MFDDLIIDKKDYGYNTNKKMKIAKLKEDVEALRKCSSIPNCYDNDQDDQCTAVCHSTSSGSSVPTRPGPKSR